LCPTATESCPATIDVEHGARRVGEARPTGEGWDDAARGGEPAGADLEVPIVAPPVGAVAAARAAVIIVGTIFWKNGSKRDKEKQPMKNSVSGRLRKEKDGHRDLPIVRGIRP
jgi:hypothetical protein